MQIGKQSIRCIYQTVLDNDLEIIGVGADFQPLRLQAIPFNKNTDVSDLAIDSLKVNAFFDFDIRDGEIPVRDIVKELNTSHYDNPTRLYVYPDGEVIEISYIFIKKLRNSSRMGQRAKFNIACLTKDDQYIPLFSIPTDLTSEADSNIINFEIERFLRMENVTIVDQDDMKYLFELAIDYVKELHETKGVYKT